MNWRTFANDGESYAWLVIHLGLCLVCTDGTPVADMLAHSPPLPLVIDYDHENPDMAAEDKEGFTLAFQEHDRVRRVRLRMLFDPAEAHHCYQQEISKVGIPDYSAFGGKIRVRFLHFQNHFKHHIYVTLCYSTLPFYLDYSQPPRASSTLALSLTNLSTYFQPNVLLQWISSMPQLETLMIAFSSLFPTVIRDTIHAYAYHDPHHAP